MIFFKNFPAYRFQLIQGAICPINPDQQLIEGMLELTQVQQGMLQLLLALDHATE